MTRIAIVGAGAAGTLTAIHLAQLTAERAIGLDICLIDPVEHIGRGVAYSTTDQTHLLNIRAGAMSAFENDPGHFARWLKVEDDTFAPRAQFGQYLAETLEGTIASSPSRLDHLRTKAERIRCNEAGVMLSTSDDDERSFDAVVLATGLPTPTTAWAPRALRHWHRLISDPWAPGALESIDADNASVLLVGTGLTMLDIASTVAARHPSSTLHAISRTGRIPFAHTEHASPASIPDVATWGASLADIRARTREHLRQSDETLGNWRPGMDGMRHVAADLWSRLSEPDRHEFLRRHATAWNLRRHRVPPATAATIASLRHAKRLHVEPATLIHAAPVPGPAIQVTLTNGKTLKVDWVVNCTGPARDHSRLRLHVDAVHATAGMGLRTLEGRVLDRRGSAARPIWAVGALRRGELWESTAVPEIRAQVSQVVTAALNVAPASSGTTPLVRPSEARRDPFYTKLVK